MSFKNFKDYLTERATGSHGVVSDDKGFANRDYDGGLALKPKPGKHLRPEEYYAKGANKNPGLMTADGSDRGQPFGDMATPGLTPKNSAPHGIKPTDKTKKVGKKGKGKLPTKKAMKVEHFLSKTKKMSNVQFTKHMLEDVKNIPVPKVRDLYGREYVPEPAQTMKYVAHLMLTNENMMRRMVRELKRNNGFSVLVNEVLQHPETYQHLNEAVHGGYGEVPQKKLGLFLETVSPPRAGKGPASAGAPGGGGAPQTGGPFGGGGGAPSGPPGAGISGGPDAGGALPMNVGGGAPGGMPGGMPGMGGPPGGMQGMGEEEMMPGMGGPPGMGEEGGEIEPEMDDDLEDGDDEGIDVDSDDDLVDDDEDEDDLDDDDEEFDLDDEDSDEDEDDDEEEDHMDDDEMMGGGAPGMDMMGMGGMGGGGMGMGM